MRASLRTRLLLLGLGAAAIAWAWMWTVDDAIPPARGGATRLAPVATPRIPTIFLARLGASRWSPVAESYGGC